VELAALVVAAAAIELPASLTPDAHPLTSATDAAAAAAPERVEAPVVETPTVETPAVETPAVVEVAALPLSRRARRATSAAPLVVEAAQQAETQPGADAAPTTAAVFVATAPALEAAAAASVQSRHDDFEQAARLFAFSPAVAAPTARTEPEQQTECALVRAQPRPPRWASARKRLAAASVSIGAMGLVGLLAVGMTTPAGAVGASAAKGSAATTSLAAAAPSGDEEIQAFVASSTVGDVTLNRDESYSTATMSDLAAASGVRNFDNSFINNPNSPVQWPFPVGVPYTWGFEMRDGSLHHGIDFVPGQGAEIHAIADGTVRIATESGGLYGVHVVIDHEIDGELVSSHYAHMEYGSLRVKTGDPVKVGEVLGTVGDTGYSFGAHLHFEVWQNGTTKIDPLPWMKEHTAG